MGDDNYNNRKFNSFKKIKDDENENDLIFLILGYMSTSSLDPAHRVLISKRVAKEYTNFLKNNIDLRHSESIKEISRLTNRSIGASVRNALDLKKRAGKNTNIVLLKNQKEALLKGKKKKEVVDDLKNTKIAKTLKKNDYKKYNSNSRKSVEAIVLKTLEKEPPEKVSEIVAKKIKRYDKKKYKLIIEHHSRMEDSLREFTISKEIEKRLKKTMVKTWTTQRDSKVRLWHMKADRQKRKGRNKKFRVMGEFLLFPRDPKGSLKNVINCRCYLNYRFS